MLSHKMRTIGVLIAIALFAVAVAENSAGAEARRATQQTDQSGNSAPASGPQLTPADIDKLRTHGLRNFSVVTPTLYRGGQPTSEGFRMLASMGVDIVVNLRVTHREGERQEVTELGMQYVEISWNCFDPQDSDIVKFLMLVRQNPGKKIFVHCQTGDDRTGMEIAAYRMAEQGWTAERALQEMEALGFNVIHRTVCPGLGAYETKFPERFATSPAFQELKIHGIAATPAAPASGTPATSGASTPPTTPSAPATPTGPANPGNPAAPSEPAPSPPN
jgi:protein tyrosine phosphatase (PTP) superfamily phosphohydrolase (DUF442 family)